MATLDDGGGRSRGAADFIRPLSHRQTECLSSRRPLCRAAIVPRESPLLLDLLRAARTHWPTFPTAEGRESSPLAPRYRIYQIMAIDDRISAPTAAAANGLEKPGTGF